MPSPRRPFRPAAHGPTVRNDPGDWRLRALCRSFPAQWWDDSLDGLRETREQRQARHAQAVEVCRRCPVAAQCEADYDRSLDEGVRFGRVLPPLGPPSRVARFGSGDKGGRPRSDGQRRSA